MAAAGVCVFLLATFWQPVPAAGQGGRQREQKRAQRPTFAEGEWEGIFFRDLFAEGLVGNPPAASEQSRSAAGGSGPPAPTVKAGTTPAAAPSSAGAWSGLIDRDSLEDEIKRLQNGLDGQLTTPNRFSTGYREVNQVFEMLSVWFAIIMEYDSDVRWKEQAPAVLASLLVASNNTRRGGEDSFRSAVATRDSLAGLIRGGSFSGSERPANAVDWSAAMNRTTIMKNLDALLPELKSAAGSESSFRGASEELLKGSQLVAALGHVLSRPGADTADDDGYVRLANSMESAAAALTTAVRAGDFSGAQTAVNQIEQSCNNCHNEWR